jgi:hypothetical protein
MVAMGVKKADKMIPSGVLMPIISVMTRDKIPNERDAPNNNT